MRGVKLDHDLVDAKTGEVVAEAGDQADAARLRASWRRRAQGDPGPRRGAGRPLRRQGHGQRADRRDLSSRPATRLTEEMLARARRGRRRGRSRRCTIDHVNVGPYIRNTLAVDKNTTARGRADRHLPGHAPGRAADAGDRRGPVPRPVLRFRALRPVGRRPGQDERAPRPRDATTRCACCARRTSSRWSRCWSTSRTARARSTTSTISATAACARSAS